jgi:hypothetical protein
MKILIQIGGIVLLMAGMYFAACLVWESRSLEARSSGCPGQRAERSP